jgi:glycosyltransferase involved in cell wall biosynthesis
MRVVMEDLFDSRLGADYEMDWLSTFEGPGWRRRLLSFSRSLLLLSAWSVRGRGRIVHVHATVRGSMYRKAICVLLAKALRRRVVLHVHSGPGDLETFRAGLGGVRAALLGFAIRRADVVVAVSEPSATRLRAGFGVDEIVVIPNPAPPPAADLAAAGDREPPLAIFLGGFENPVKGGAEVLAALERLEPGAFEFDLAGPGEPSPAELAAIEARPGTRWLGWIEGEELRRLYAESSVFVLSSTSEGLPMALLEAMSRGMAIAATEVGGVPDVLDDEVEGLLVPPGDVGALAAALGRLAGDRGLRERLGRAARERAAAMGPEGAAAGFDAIYRELLRR